MSAPAPGHPSAFSLWDHGPPQGTSPQNDLSETAHPDDDLAYPQAAEDSVVAPADFRPFFTLITDTSTDEHHHPLVQYIFSDDDPDHLTTTIADTLNPRQESTRAQRVVLLDVAQDGKTIAAVHSLSADWQVAQACIGQAPSWNEQGPERATGGLMLEIQGTEDVGLADDKAVGQEEGEDAIDRIQSSIQQMEGHLMKLEALMETSALENSTEHP